MRGDSCALGRNLWLFLSAFELMVRLSLSLSSVAVFKYHDQKQLKEERILFLLVLPEGDSPSWWGKPWRAGRIRKMVDCLVWAHRGREKGRG